MKALLRTTWVAVGVILCLFLLFFSTPSTRKESVPEISKIDEVTRDQVYPHSIQVLNERIESLEGSLLHERAESASLPEQENTSRKENRVLIGITAYNRKQHVHLKQMILSIVNICESGYEPTVLIYTSDDNLFTKDEEEELRSLGTCSRIESTVDIRIFPRPADLQLKMTLEHRREFLEMIDNYDYFVYTEDDMNFELRHLSAYIKETAWLERSSGASRYLVGFQRYEENGISLGHTQVIWENSADAWFPVEIDGRLFMIPQNIHGGLYVLTRSQLKALSKKCGILRVPDVKGSFVRVRASGWDLYLHCQKRKIIPLDNFHNFLVHHLPDKNWNSRSKCYITVDQLGQQIRSWLKRRAIGDTSMVCGNWWEETWCRKNIKALPAKERSIKGSCPQWINTTSQT